MAVDYQEIFKAIRDKWRGDADLFADVPDIDWRSANRIRDMPCAVFQMASAETQPVLSPDADPKDVERVVFDLVVYDDARSVANIAKVYSNVLKAFDRKALTYSGGYGHVVCRRLPSGTPIVRDPNDVWQALASFELLAQEL